MREEKLRIQARLSQARLASLLLSIGLESCIIFVEIYIIIYRAHYYTGHAIFSIAIHSLQ